MFILVGSIREFSDTFICLKMFYFEELNPILYKKQFRIVCGQIFLYVQNTGVCSIVHLSGLNVLFDQINVFKIPEKIIVRANLCKNKFDLSNENVVHYRQKMKGNEINCSKRLRGRLLILILKI